MEKSGKPEMVHLLKHEHEKTAGRDAFAGFKYINFQFGRVAGEGRSMRSLVCDNYASTDNHLSRFIGASR